MHSTQHGFDLNLLTVFKALYHHKNVNKASESIFISPSAFSHALNRLREVVDDPLFIRMKGEMLPTKRAEEIAPFIFESLELVSNQLFQPKKFDARSSDKEFIIATTDYTAFCVLPELMKNLEKIAPNIRIKVITESKNESLQNLILGKVDAVIGYSEHDEINNSSIDVYECCSDHYVVIASKGIYNSINLKEYIEANHIKVSAWKKHHGIIDQALKEIHLERKITLELPNMMIVPYILGTTNLMITLPNKAVEIFKKLHKIDVFPLPLDIPDYKINLYTSTKEISQVWLINEIKKLF
ncbi:LysR family transcriptional regulator [Acinetobacter qingfengensis]|nr:LysR family transcriptional regulator [Acinetobacter qingfengensis]